jgi:hypothetical protein
VPHRRIRHLLRFHNVQELSPHLIECVKHV